MKTCERKVRPELQHFAVCCEYIHDWLCVVVLIRVEEEARELLSVLIEDISVVAENVVKARCRFLEALDKHLPLEARVFAVVNWLSYSFHVGSLVLFALRCDNDVLLEVLCADVVD